MAPLIHAYWRRQARTSGDDKTPTSVAGGISAATSVDDNSDSRPSTSLLAGKHSDEESLTKIEAKPTVTRSAKGLDPTTATAASQEAPIPLPTSRDIEEPKSTAVDSTQTTDISEPSFSSFLSEVGPTTTSRTPVNDVPETSTRISPSTIAPEQSSISTETTPPAVPTTQAPTVSRDTERPPKPTVVLPSSHTEGAPVSETVTSPAPTSSSESTNSGNPAATTRTAGDDPESIQPTNTTAATPTTPATTKSSENVPSGNPSSAVSSSISSSAIPTPSTSTPISEGGGQEAPLATITPPAISSTLPTNQAVTENVPENTAPVIIVSSAFPSIFNNAAPGIPVTGITSSPTPARSTPTAEAAQGSGSGELLTLVITETLLFTSQTTLGSGPSATVIPVVSTSIQTRTTVTPKPTSSVVGTTSATKTKTTAMIGGIIGGAIILLTISLLALCLIRRRRRNEEIRAFLVASPDPFPHSARPQAAFPASPFGSKQMTAQTYPTTPVPQFTYSSVDPPEMVEAPNTHTPSTITVARKQPIPFLGNLDLGTENRLSMRSTLPSSTSLFPGQAHMRPVADKDPFADPDRNPFEDPRPAVPTVVVHPATPEPGHSATPASSNSKEYGVAV